MLETIAGVCRALACDVKLRVLYHVSLRKELTVKELAAALHIEKTWISHHLARLASVGLLDRRRSGAHVYYRLGSEATGQPGFVPTELLRRAFVGPGWATRGWPEERAVHLLPATVAAMGKLPARVADVAFDAATAFGNVRRLQIVRRLVEKGACEESRFVTDLSMSPQACSRHIDKLKRRGYVRAIKPGKWGLCNEARTPFHRALLSAVVQALRQVPE